LRGYAIRYTKALDSIKTLRKERVAELKTEKERLEGFSREKFHADKLKARMADLSSTIATKEVRQEELAAELEEAITSNHRLNELASKFREVFLKVDGLEKEKQRYEAEYDEAKINAQIIEGIYR
jgi:DNA repair protein RAD50